MRIVAALVGVAAVLFTFLGRELLSALLISWLAFSALAIFILIAWWLGHFMLTLWDLL